MCFSVVHVADVEPAGPGGAIRFVRRALGVDDALSVAGSDGMAFVSIGVPPGAYEPHGPF
jgi:hypothetical protein